MEYGNTNTTLDARLTGIISYCSFAGWLIAYLIGDKKNEVAKFHLTQGLACNLLALLSGVPYIGWIWGLFIIVISIIGMFAANKLEMTKLPIASEIDILSKLNA